MKRNIKTLGVIGLLGVFGCGYLVYGYSSVGDSLNYIKSSGDTGHVGYILTEIFGNDDKIDSKYLDITGTSVTGATINNSGVVQLVNSTGSTSQTQAPTINLMTQVWNQLSASINTKISTELDPTVNSLAKAVLSCSDNQIVKRSGVTWVCSNYVDTSYTHPVGDGNLHVPVTSTTNSGKVLMAGGSAGNIFWSLLQKADIGLGNVDNTSDVNKPVSSATQAQLNLKANIASPMLTGTPSSQEVLNVNDNDSSLATTKFVQDRVSAVSAASGGSDVYYTTSGLCEEGFSLGNGKYIDNGVSHNICLKTSTSVNNTCAGGNVTGNTCGTQNKAKYVGVYNNYNYMITPSGCQFTTLNPICNGGGDSIRMTYGKDVQRYAKSTVDGIYNANLLTAFLDSEAARYCDELIYGGYSDWFLPASEELAWLTGYNYSSYSSSLNLNRAYWSSTEHSTLNSYSCSNGGCSNDSKSNQTYVRCVRKY